MNLLPILHIIVSVIIVILILLQERSSGLSSIFGSESGGFYQARRGLERVVFGATIVFGIIFVILSILELVAR